jgi:hypothetical protein
MKKALLLVTLAIAANIHAKEVELPLDKCPAAVQATIQQQLARAQGKLDKVEYEKKDGVEFYDAKIVGATGTKWTVKISPDGRTLEVKEKKAK